MSTDAQGSSGSGVDRKVGSAVMGNLPTEVGEGVHSQPLMMAVIQGITELSMDVADLKGATYKSYEGPADWRYIREAVDYKKTYGKRCQEAKGTSKVVGHVKNYVLAGMFMSYKRDPTNSVAEKERMEELIGKLLRDDSGKLDLENSKNLDRLVAHCQVIPGKKKSYVNLKMREGDGEEVDRMIEKALLREGARQWDPPPPRAVHKELKNAMTKARRQG